MSGATSAVALSAAGAGMSTVGSYYSAKGQQTSLRYQADIAETNARMSELAAQTELQRGQRAEQNSRLKTANMKSAQRTAMAANGIDLGQGTALDIQTTTDVMGEIDANTIAANSIAGAWGYRTQATNYRNQGLMNRASADAISPGMAAFGTLLTSASKVSQTWYMTRDALGGAKTDTSALGDTSWRADEMTRIRASADNLYGDDPLLAFGKTKGFW